MTNRRSGGAAKRRPRTPAKRTAEQIGSTDLGPRAVPALMKVRSARPPSAETVVLPNGLRVVAVRRPGAPLVEARLRIPFGTRPGKGVPAFAARAELLAATTMLGTAGRSREQVDIDLADAGAHLSAGVDPQRLLYTGSVLATELPVLLEVLADVLTTAAYRTADVNGERDRLVEHLLLANAQPSVVARVALQDHRFGDHPAATEMPDAEQVGQVSAAAVRSQHRRSVVPDGATLVLVGDLTPGKATQLAAAALGDWSGSRSATVLGTPPAVTGAPLVAVNRPGSVQSQVRLTAAGVVRTDPDYPALQIANLIYSGYFSSRLVENIREDKGYTYSAHSALEFWPGASAITISFDTNTASTAPALLEARYELGRLALTAPTEAEVESARNYALGSLAISLSTQSGYASTLSAMYGAGLDQQWLRDHPARLAAVTGDQIAAVAAQYFAPANVTGVVVGDLSAMGTGLLKLGSVTLP